jgi:hypothetical protein
MPSSARFASQLLKAAQAIGLAILLGTLGVACGSATLKTTDGGAGASGKGGSSGAGGATGQGGSSGTGGLAGAGGAAVGPACVLDSTQVDNCILK